MTTDQNNPKVLASVPNEPEAAAIVAALMEHGIEATTTGNFTASFDALVPHDVKVVVKNKDLVRAKALIEEINQARSDVDWSQIDVG